MKKINKLLVATLVIVFSFAMPIMSFADVELTNGWSDGMAVTTKSVNLEGSTDYEKLLNLMYPVGSYFSTANGSFDPNTAWGGHWELIDEGLTLIQAGGTYTLGSTGGEAEHALTADEMPPHRHWISGAAYDDGNMSTSGSNSQDFGLAGDAGSYTAYDQAKSNGRYNAYAGGIAGADGRGANGMDMTVTPHNNMPPYIACNIWKRVS